MSSRAHSLLSLMPASADWITSAFRAGILRSSIFKSSNIATKVAVPIELLESNPILDPLEFRAEPEL